MQIEGNKLRDLSQSSDEMAFRHPNTVTILRKDGWNLKLRLGAIFLSFCHQNAPSAHLRFAPTTFSQFGVCHPPCWGCCWPAPSLLCNPPDACRWRRS